MFVLSKMHNAQLTTPLAGNCENARSHVQIDNKLPTQIKKDKGMEDYTKEDLTYMPLQTILKHAKTRHIPSSYVRINQSKANLTDIMYIMFVIVEASLSPAILQDEPYVQQGSSTEEAPRDIDLTVLREEMEAFRVSEQTLHRNLFYASTNRTYMYVHALVEAIDEYSQQKHAVRMLHILRDVMVIHWTKDLSYEDIKRSIVSLRPEVMRALEADMDNLAFLESQHSNIYRAL